MKPELALSIKQPWAWLIGAGFKDVENRNWPIGRNPHHGPYQSQQANFSITLPSRVYIHAGKGRDIGAINSILCCQMSFEFPHDALDYIFRAESDDTWPLGAIIGEVDIVACVKDSKSTWAQKGYYHFVLENPKLYDFVIHCSGRLGFFPPDVSIPARAEYQGG